MKYTRFNEHNKHEETCEFELFRKGDFILCGEKAVGRRGSVEHTRMYLCEEHFDYGASLDGVAQFEIKREVKK